MTTEKKSSLSERLKNLRDKVADVITAAEEEESSVAEAVSPEKSVQATPASETVKKSVKRRASDDEVASALMKFTWANDQHAQEEKPEDIKAFFEGYLSENEPTAEEANEPEENETAKWEPELESAAEAVDIEEAESESARLDRIIAEAEALLDRDEPNVPIAVSEEDVDPAQGEDILCNTEKEDIPELSKEPEPVQAAELITESERSDHEDHPAESHDEDSFNWAELLMDVPDGAPVHLLDSESSPAETTDESIPEELNPTEQDDSASITLGTGFAALLSSLKKNADKKQENDANVEEIPDISIFLKDIEGSSETGEEENEPNPSDVARLWEPHAERKAEAAAAHDPYVDPIREETHVFTEEDLKNMPKEDTQTDSSETGSSVAVYSEADAEDEGYTPRDFRPIRRRRYYRTGLVGGIMYFLFVICVSIALACFAWLAADDMLSLNKEYLEAEVYVGSDMSVDQVATELQTKGLIRYRRLFALFGKFFHADEKIEPGTYNLSTKLDYRALIQNMHHYTGWTGEELATVKVTIPEGKTVMETFQILAEHGVCPYETLMECAATEVFDYSFLADLPKGDATRLEGYLFPDTYEFYADSSPKAAICRFLDNFGDRIGDRVTEQAAAQGYTLRQILTVASLIEKEAGNDLERATIASVIYNRLQSTSYPYLQIDATIQYAMGEHKEHLTNEDLQVDSPYNTYLYPGLPPGPIANPGLASIRAALNPESTGYYFYALNKNGKHEFFSSYSAFERFINSSNFGG